MTKRELEKQVEATLQEMCYCAAPGVRLSPAMEAKLDGAAISLKWVLDGCPNSYHPLALIMFGTAQKNRWEI